MTVIVEQLLLHNASAIILFQSTAGYHGPESEPQEGATRENLCEGRSTIPNVYRDCLSIFLVNAVVFDVLLKLRVLHLLHSVDRHRCSVLRGSQPSLNFGCLHMINILHFDVISSNRFLRLDCVRVSTVW